MKKAVAQQRLLMLYLFLACGNSERHNASALNSFQRLFRNNNSHSVKEPYFKHSSEFFQHSHFYTP